MPSDPINASRRRLLFFGLISTLATTSVGCAAATRERIRRVGMARRLGSTIGRNLNEEPAGRSIPASGLGVDLVSGTVVESPRVERAVGAVASARDK